MNKEEVKTDRAQARRLFTRGANKLEEMFKNLEELEVTELQFKLVEDKAETLFGLDKQVRNFILSDIEVKEEEVEAEYDAVEIYRDRWLSLKIFIETKRAEKCQIASQQILKEAGKANGSLCSSMSRLKLPKLELRKFCGDPKEWIGFWAQFKKIHENDELDKEDKFQYLIQSLQEGSQARKVVERFPPSAENYTKAISHLKRRFGRDGLLIPIYVRELLDLALQASSHLKLGDLYDRLETQIRALETLGVTTDKFAYVLYPMVESAIPEEILLAWERKRRDKYKGAEEVEEESADDLENFLNFLKDEVESQERLLLAKGNFNREKNNKDKEHIPTAAMLLNDEKITCVFCGKSSHKSAECFKAREMTNQERKESLIRRRCCYNCLRPGHSARFCKVYVKCFICSKRHQTVMCAETPAGTEHSGTDKEGEKMETKEANTANLLAQEAAEVTLLQTLRVKIKSPKGAIIVRALLDSGSQKSYIKKECVVGLGLASYKEQTFTHCLFGGEEIKQQKHKIYEVTLQSLDSKFTSQVQLFDQERICSYIPRLKDSTRLNILKEKKIVLNDTGKDAPEVKLLLGADILSQIVTGKVEQLGDRLIAVETRLGWTVMGVSDERYDNVLLSMLNNEKIPDLWRLEALGIKEPAEVRSQKMEEEEALKHFYKTVSVSEEGRYVVELPWIFGHQSLESNRILAEKRLRAVTRKLQANGRFADYDRVFQEWLSSGIVEQAMDDDRGHYLPHHAVIKEQSLTTKVRPVFDASAMDAKGNTLNTCLFKGDNFIELIPSLIYKFRKKELGLCADIEKAFLQIVLKEKERDYFKFLWWADPEGNLIKVFRHTRVVFGVKCSPFILGAVIKHHLNNAPEQLRETAGELQTSFYVDNLVTSVRCKEELEAYMVNSKSLMGRACFNLREWCYTGMKGEREMSLLGMMWNASGDDTLRCSIASKNIQAAPLTKRKLLSAAQQVFDPIGHTCPTTIIPKLLLQQTWQLKLGWDMELPQEIRRRFNSWLAELSFIEQCKIPRTLKPPGCDYDLCSLHVFADASKLAYAACVFMRTERGEDVHVELVAAKSRIAPLKQTTIPRLELLGALIASRLANSVRESLNLFNIPIYFWTDSMVVLAWIRRTERWSVFVANRVKEIKESSRLNEWHHIPGEYNPADIPSRGCSPKALYEGMWWKGPQWMREPIGSWPHSKEVAPDEEVNKERQKTVISTAAIRKNDFTDCLRYFSNYHKLVRMVGWILRFGYNSRRKDDRRERDLSYEEFREAERRLLRNIQEESFGGKDMKFLKNLSKICDAEGIWRVNTKIRLPEETYDFERPIILPSKHHIVEKLIMSEHQSSLHAGLQTMLSNLRERYWILKARKTVRKVIGSCRRCKRFNAQAVDVPFAPLPKERIRCSAPFETTGVDLAGPLILRSGNKCWVVLFTCAVYRAIHLDLVKSLSTDDFIAALRRFIARKGRPVTIFSDNGTNFRGTSNVLRSLDWDEIQAEAAVKRISWKFNPPTAAWWGGWWERLVRSVKELLRRNLGNAVVTSDELYTLLCDCEAVINSRPLTYIAEDTEELRPLTPATFLQCLPNGTPDLDKVDCKSLQKRERYLQYLREALRRRFRTEYLSLLTHRGRRSPTSLQQGDVVLVEKENSKRIYWPLGIIEEVIPGPDGYARVARVRTNSGEVIRPFQRLYLLETDNRSSPERREDENQSEQERGSSESGIEERRTRTRVIKIPQRLDL